MTAPTAPTKQGMPVSSIVAIGIAATVALFVLVFGGLFLLGAFRSPTSSTPPARAAADDVAIRNCSADQAGGTAEFTVTNSTTRTRTYTISVSFRDDQGVQLDTGLAVVRDLQPGQTGVATAYALTDHRVNRCVVTGVDRV
jgi:hypothetical protein